MSNDENRFHEALIIVDMQGYFATAKNPSTIKNVKSLIKEFKKKRLPIIVLEYHYSFRNLGHTLPCITKMLDDYYYARYVRKSDDDGGVEVIECLNKNGWNIGKFKVCGVNIGACVRDTVCTLVHDFNMKVDVVRRACNGQYTRKDAFTRNSNFYDNTPNLAVV
jgi:nicotinamidase-related amidase